MPAVPLTFRSKSPPLRGSVTTVLLFAIDGIFIEATLFWRDAEFRLFRGSRLSSMPGLFCNCQGTRGEKVGRVDGQRSLYPAAIKRRSGLCV